MPVDRQHAFGSGAAYARPATGRTSHFVRKLLQPRRDLGGAEAWASFDASATVGARCLLGANAWCFNGGDRTRVQVGDDVVCRGILRVELFGDGRLVLGDRVYLGDDTIISCSHRVEIGAGVLIAHGVQIFDNNSHPLDPVARSADWQAVVSGGPRQAEAIESAPVVIGRDAWIGFGAFVLKGVTIGEAAVVAAGSVVTGDVAPRSIVGGNPARELRRI